MTSSADVLQTAATFLWPYYNDVHLPLSEYAKTDKEG